jgi:hypothetical protein
MGQATPAKKQRENGHHVRDRKILEGDIVVTAVGRHYAIGRMTADRATQESLGAQPKLAAAVQQACDLAGVKHRVFLYPSTGTTNYVRFVCPKRST